MINRLKEYREKASLSQTELAWLAKVASQNISAIERGTMIPWPKIRKSLAEALKVAESELFPEVSEDARNNS